MLSVRTFVSVWLWPGVSGPQLPTVKSSPEMHGVPASSTREPEAVKKSPLLMTDYPSVTRVGLPVQMSGGLALLARSIWHRWGVTVAVAVLLTVPVPLVPEAVAVLVRAP